MSKTFTLAALVALTQARFNQEGIPGAAVAALGDFGNPGEAGTLSGKVPGVLLAAANSCDKLSLADEIVTTLGTDAAVIAAAAALVAAEKNFNPFAQTIPTICSDATLPVTVELRGIIPLVDPDVLGSEVQNDNSALSLQTPFDAVGLSVAEIVIAQGFTNFTSQAADGATEDNAGADAGAADAGAADDAADAGAAVDCGGAAAADDAAKGDAGKDDAAKDDAGKDDAAKDDAAKDDGAKDDGAAAGAGNAAVQQSTVAGLDFGLCVPTMKFEAGLNGRKETEFTFQAVDSIVNKGQQEALNFNIITNRICDQLGNVCEANDAAKAACDAAATKIADLGREVATADAWNTELGFDGADTNPDNAPQAGLVGHA